MFDRKSLEKSTLMSEWGNLFLSAQIEKCCIRTSSFTINRTEAAPSQNSPNFKMIKNWLKKVKWLKSEPNRRSFQLHKGLPQQLALHIWFDSFIIYSTVLSKIWNN